MAFPRIDAPRGTLPRMSLIALLNGSTRLKSADASLIAQAVSWQLRVHAAPAWGKSPWTCAFYQDPSTAPKTAFRLWLLDDPDVSGALGYHDLDPDGMPYGKVFAGLILDDGGDVHMSANSVSVTTSHEALEIFGDPYANWWAQMPDGRDVALELCDPVEGDAYPINVGAVPVMVSNFAFPEWFDGGTPITNRWDKMRRLTAPWTMTPGGYLIVKESGQVSNVWGQQYPESRKALKCHPASRTQRRR
jgi:hypothetical protein